MLRLRAERAANRQASGLSLAQQADDGLELHFNSLIPFISHTHTHITEQDMNI